MPFSELLGRLQSAFFRQVATLSLGRGLAAAIPLLIAPVLTRLYSAEDIGIYGLFMAVLAVLAVLGTLRYDLAVILPVDAHTATGLVNATLLIAAAFFVLVSAGAMIWTIAGIGYPEAMCLENWIWMVPPAILLTNCFKLFESVQVRLTRYSRISTSYTINALVRGGVQIGFASFVGGPVALIAGVLTGLLAGTAILLPSPVLQWQPFSAIRQAAIKYKKYPTITTPAGLASILSGQLLIILLPFSYSATMIGYYALAQRFVQLPSDLVGMNINTVFLRRSTAAGHDRRTLQALFRKVITYLVISVVPVFLILAFVIEPAFGIVFGEEWHAAGRIALIFLPLAFTRLLLNSTTAVIHATDKQEIGLYHNLFTLVIVAACYLCFRQADAMTLFLWVSVLLALENLGVLFVYWRLLHGQPVR